MRLKRMAVGVVLFPFAVIVATARQPAPDTQLLAKAKAIHERAITLDSHVDISGTNYATPEVDPGIDNPRLKCDLSKMERGGMKGVFLAVFVGQTPNLNPEGYKRAYDQAIAKFDALARLTQTMYPDRCAFARTPDEVERIARSGKRVIMTGIENGYPLGEDLGLVQKFYDLGARYITLAHSGNNQICDSSSASQPLNNGLSEFGRRVVAEMNRVGIMVDVSHISAKSFWDVISVSKAPIIASHSGCTAITKVGRNLDDDQLKALSKNGGVIQIVSLSSYLKEDPPERRQAIQKLREELGVPRQGQPPQAFTDELRARYDERMKEIDTLYPRATLADMINHLDHAVKVAGIDHVGIGTDFDGGGGVSGFNDHSEALNVTVELVRRGYTEEQIRKIWGGNLLRVWRDVIRVAARLQKAH
jgi:membrane dipeptidase